MIGNKVHLSNGKSAKIIKEISPLSVIIHYQGNEGESVRLVSYEEIMTAPIELCLFDKTITGANSNYTPVKRDVNGNPR
jgi:hypothetical protein